MQQLEGTVAFITGGASGIGLGLAKVFAEEAGVKVAIADVQQRRLDEAMNYFRAKRLDVLSIKLDITDRSAYSEIANEVEQRLGPVQILMNNAGISERGPIENSSYADWDWHIDVNLMGVINGIQTFLPRMIKLGRGGTSSILLHCLLSLPGRLRGCIRRRNLPSVVYRSPCGRT
jgi:NAD(P)-dependent dehydrogenase (short-subunit alcohol dehydrogenase family)